MSRARSESFRTTVSWSCGWPDGAVACFQRDLWTAAASVLSLPNGSHPTWLTFSLGIRRKILSSMSRQEWQSATNLEARRIGQAERNSAEELLISMSSFGGAEKRTSTLPLRLSTLTLPPAFSRVMSSCDPHAEVARSVKDFEVARASLHMAGELRRGEISCAVK